MFKSVIATATATACTAACVIPAGSAQAELKVVVTSKPIHSLVAGVMAGVGVPKLLIEGNASPHTYALKPSGAKALNGADVVFRVSEALEPFTTKVFASLPKQIRTVSLARAPGLTLLDRREGGAFEAHSHFEGHHYETGHAEDETDPHVWLDPRNAKQITAYIATTLATAAPADASHFTDNAARLSAEFDALDTEIAAELKPLSALPLIVFHDSLHYLEVRYGLTAVGSIMVAPDRQPSAKRLADLRKKVESAKATCVLAEPQFPNKLVASITEGTTARTTVVDPEGGLLDPGPGLYPTLMRRLATALKGCLPGA